MKTPGDGRTYAVGTTWSAVDPVTMLPYNFSGVAVQLPLLTPLQGTKQVAVLQASDSTGIVWQRLFYGGNNITQGVYARGISVFPMPTAAQTRIAICGETYDQNLPLATAPNVMPPTWLPLASGFIAVYNGDGFLLWSYQFFGNDPFAATVISDVSIRVNSVAVPPVDVVTYCGASTNGRFVDPTNPIVSTMPPVRPFLPPPPLSPCGDIYSGGAVHNAPLATLHTDQWDGIVGRLSAPETPVGVLPPVNLVFHSIVGGADQDALFGLSERDPQVFSVAGTITKSSAGNGTLAFPLTNTSFGSTTVCFGPGSPWASGLGGSLGVVLTFSDPGAGAPLVLLGSCVLGEPTSYTNARDVLWHGGSLYAVGSTTDPGFTGSYQDAFYTTLGGASNGYVVASDDLSNTFGRGSYLHRIVAGAQSGATGLAAWNEYRDHVAVTGWIETLSGAGVRRSRVIVSSLFQDSRLGRRPLLLLRDHEIDASSQDRRDYPGAWWGFQSAIGPTGVPGYLAAPPLGFPAGGGIGVDERGGITVVGNSTREASGAQFTVVAGGLPAEPGMPTLLPPDAIRAVVDMLPDGVCRSDGTGSCPSWSPASGVYGGTTPVCALAMFGTTQGPPSLYRMFVDLEGAPIAGSPAAVLVDRPPASTLSAGVLQLGFPSTSPISVLAFPGIDIWANASTPVVLPQVIGDSSLREPLWGPAGLPSGSNTFSIQFTAS